MKIRWNRSSLRLRITPSELAMLLGGSSIHERLQVPGATGTGWGVTVRPGDNMTCLTQDGCALTLSLSPLDLVRLSEPEREGIYFSVGDSADRFAHYIEKDYPCAHPRAEEVQALGTDAETETFMPPLTPPGR